MKKPFLVMLTLFVIIVVVVGGGVGTYLYLKHNPAQAKPAQALTPAEAEALQFTLPQMTTNLKAQGLIQFTLTLQADDKSTAHELAQMQNQIQDTVNLIMRTFSSNQLRTVSGFDQLKAALLKKVNQMLSTGHVTKVYLSQMLVQ